MSQITKIVKEDVQMDMTPMIDCVFLLMIFFVLVIDLSQKNLEDLVLPRAVFIQPDEKPSPTRPIINVLQNGSVVYNQAVAYNPQEHGKDYTRIRELLRSIRQTGLAKGTLKLKDEKVGSRTIALIDDPILIRADKWTEWHYVGEVMKQCSQQDVGFHKVELALSEMDKETKEKNPRKIQ